MRKLKHREFKLSCPKSHGQEKEELGFEPWCCVSRVRLYCTQFFQWVHVFTMYWYKRTKYYSYLNLILSTNFETLKKVLLSHPFLWINQYAQSTTAKKWGGLDLVLGNLLSDFTFVITTLWHLLRTFHFLIFFGG